MRMTNADFRAKYANRCINCDQSFGAGRYPVMQGGPNSNDWACQECADAIQAEIDALDQAEFDAQKCADCGSRDVVVVGERQHDPHARRGLGGFVFPAAFCGPCLDQRFSKMEN
jgi:DNA-directed RNA polymerase subunit RPC12/RpoP